MLGLLARQQIEVAADGLRGAARTDVPERLAIRQADGGGDAGYLHQIGLAVATRHKLRRSIADAVDVDREDGHRAGWNG